jgi:hypothetical protein
MFLEDIPVNYLAVVLAAVVYFILGAVWYSPKVFGSMWMKHNPSVVPSETNRTNMIVAFIGEAVIGLIMAYILAVFIRISQADAVIKGIVVSLWIWLGFIATTHFSAVLWGRKSLINFFIHAGFLLTAILLMGAIISGLR